MCHIIPHIFLRQVKRSVVGGGTDSPELRCSVAVKRPGLKCYIRWVYLNVPYNTPQFFGDMEKVEAGFQAGWPVRGGLPTPRPPKGPGVAGLGGELTSRVDPLRSSREVRGISSG